MCKFNKFILTFTVSLFFYLVFVLSMQVNASGVPNTGTSLDNNPYVSWSPDYKAWTLNAGVFGTDVNHFHDYDDFYTIYTGVKGTEITVPEGYHIFAGKSVSIINIERWECQYSSAFCIHQTATDGMEWHGMYFTDGICMRQHLNGWIGYCADCGQRIYILIYGTDAAMSSLKSIPAGFANFYICPYEIKYNSIGQPLSGHFEQGAEINHMCNDISANRYTVSYDANYPLDIQYGYGYTADTIHLYDNVGIYNGISDAYDTNLRVNNYTCNGYIFIGWNTKADGNGISYTDGQAVLNLTNVNNGKVILYAQWRPCFSDLVINPNGGMFDGSDDIQTFTGRSMSIFDVSSSHITPPKGVFISFVTNNEINLPSVQNTMSFSSWKSGYLHGVLNNDNQYTYSAEDNVSDTLTAQYVYDPIILPDISWENHSFAGWYFDPEFTMPAGSPGDEITVSKDTKLYAQWSELVLVSIDNYRVYDGAGAVDLSWHQNDNNGKVYKIWQSTDNINWKQLYSSSDVGDFDIVDVSFAKGAEQSYTVTSSGIYDLDLKGEPGENYGSHTGGKGGHITLRVYLKKGDVLSFDVGQGGGTKQEGGFSAGGGYTQLKINGQLVAVAGGGGGATPQYDGGNGGLDLNLVSNMNGESGMVGGGGGYQGGAAGQVIYTQFGQEQVMQQCSGRAISFNDVDSYGIYHAITSCGHNCESGLCGNGYPSYNKPSPGEQCRKQVATGHTRCSYCKSISCNGLHVTSSFPAYGGSNYLTSGFYIITSSMESGTANVCGFQIKSVSIGFQDDQYLNDVIAFDKACPDKIDRNTINIKHIDNQVSITWEQPESNGTKYYHKAQSFLIGSDTVLCESNITENTLTSEITGYYYRLDIRSSGELTELDFYRTNRQIKAELEDYDQWLHIAARDAAGNIGPAVHIRITKELSNSDIPVKWNLHTEQITIKGNNGNVYHAHDKTYYVKADGETPFTLTGNGILDGKPYAEYGINGYGFVSDSGSKQGGVYLDVAGISDGPVSSIIQQSDAGIALNTYIGYDAKYSNGMTVLACNSNFTMADGYDGRSILVWPRAYAKYEEELHTKTKWSNAGTDINNGLILIGDARPPVIHGLEILQSKDVIDRGEETVVLDIWCEDSGSGVSGFTVIITNSDTGETKTYECIGDEHELIDITTDDPLFTGTFVVDVYAYDNVRNETHISSNTMEFELDAYITRILDPHDPLFREGESGILHVKTLGFADRIEVIFPNGFSEQSIMVDYNNNREYEKNDEIQFMVPLYYLRDYYGNIDHQDDIPLTVKAYKGDTVLTAHPKISVFGVNGTVLTEFRDRIR